MIRLTSAVRYMLTTTGQRQGFPPETGPVTEVSVMTPTGVLTTCTVPFAIERKWLLITNGQFRFGMSGIIRHDATVQSVTFAAQTPVQGDLVNGESVIFPTLTAAASVFPVPISFYTYHAEWRLGVNRVNSADNVTCTVLAGLDISLVTLSPSGTQLTGTGAAEREWSLNPVPSVLPVTAKPDRAYITGAISVDGIGPVIDQRQAWAEYAP